MMPRPLYIARPLLPEREEFDRLVDEVWKSRILTNSGPFHNRLETALADHLGVPTAKLFNNGTIALLCALKMFSLPPDSEVITTPLTFAATAHAISWNGLVPVFADVDPVTLTLCPESVEKAISTRTSAILAVHVYGTVCHLDSLQEIATRHGLRLIYDSAHAFGTTVGGRGIGNFGDASVFSFHATKLFHSLEGGMIATARTEDADRLNLLRNFGIKSEEEVVSAGINGKMNELQAIMGLLNLPLVESERAKRRRLRESYSEILSKLPGIGLQPEQPGISRSEQYFPVVVDETRFGRSRDDLYEELMRIGIFARKYFHPICSDFEHYRGAKIVSARPRAYIEEVKRRLLCLPFHSGVEPADISDIEKVFRAGRH
jgi:dTDP-4-amino-4,6-dideoxygalactose transaminase